MDQGWGQFEQTKTSVTVTSIQGTLKISTLELARNESVSVSSAILEGKSVIVKWDGNSLSFDSMISITQGEKLVVTFKASDVKIKLLGDFRKPMSVSNERTTRNIDLGSHSTILTATLAFCVGFAAARFLGM